MAQNWGRGYGSGSTSTVADPQAAYQKYLANFKAQSQAPVVSTPQVSLADQQAAYQKYLSDFNSRLVSANKSAWDKVLASRTPVATKPTAPQTVSPREAYQKYLASFKAQQPTSTVPSNATVALEDQSRYLATPGTSWGGAALGVLPEAVNMGIGNDPWGTRAQQTTTSALQQMAGRAGVNPYLVKAISPLMSLAAGDTSGALRQGTGAASSVALKALNVPNLAIGPMAGVISGLVSGDSERKILENAVNSGAGGLASLFGGPLGSAAYTLARLMGLNVAQGVGEQLGMYSDLTPGYEGGFWGTQGEGTGLEYSPTENTPAWDEASLNSIMYPGVPESGESNLSPDMSAPGLKLGAEQGLITPSAFGEWAHTAERVEAERQAREAEEAAAKAAAEYGQQLAWQQQQSETLAQQQADAEAVANARQLVQQQLAERRQQQADELAQQQAEALAQQQAETLAQQQSSSYTPDYGTPIDTSAGSGFDTSDWGSTPTYDTYNNNSYGGSGFDTGSWGITPTYNNNSYGGSGFDTGSWGSYSSSDSSSDSGGDKRGGLVRVSRGRRIK